MKDERENAVLFQQEEKKKKKKRRCDQLPIAVVTQAGSVLFFLCGSSFLLLQACSPKPSHFHTGTMAVKLASVWKVSS